MSLHAVFFFLIYLKKEKEKGEDVEKEGKRKGDEGEKEGERS